MNCIICEKDAGEYGNNALPIVEARKFQSGMDKETEEINVLQEECACEKHKGSWTRECEECKNKFSEASEKRWQEKIKNVRE